MIWPIISFSGKCLGEGSIYSNRSIICMLSTPISWRYWSPETNCPRKPQWEHFLLIKAQYAGHASHQPSCTYHKEQTHVPQPLFFACTDLKASSPTTFCTPEPGDTCGCLDAELAWWSLFLFTGAAYRAESIPRFCLLAFDVCRLSSSRMQHMQPVYSKILSFV